MASFCMVGSMGGTTMEVVVLPDPTLLLAPLKRMRDLFLEVWADWAARLPSHSTFSNTGGGFRTLPLMFGLRVFNVLDDVG